MPLPVKVEHNFKEQSILDGTSEETRNVYESMNRIETNLDNLSDNLKQRFRQLVSSQLSLLKYRQGVMYTDKLNRKEKNNYDREGIDSNTGVSILRKQFSPTQKIKYITSKEIANSLTLEKPALDRSTKSPHNIANVSVSATEERKKVAPIPPPRKTRVFSERISPILDAKKAITNRIQNTTRANQLYSTVTRNCDVKLSPPSNAFKVKIEPELSTCDRETMIKAMGTGAASDASGIQSDKISKKSPIIEEKMECSPVAYNIDNSERCPTKSPSANVRALDECREDKANVNSTINRAYRAISNRREQQSKFVLKNVLPRGYKKEPSSFGVNTSISTEGESVHHISSVHGNSVSPPSISRYEIENTGHDGRVRDALSTKKSRDTSLTRSALTTNGSSSPDCQAKSKFEGFDAVQCVSKCDEDVATTDRVIKDVGKPQKSSYIDEGNIPSISSTAPSHSTERESTPRPRSESLSPTVRFNSTVNYIPRNGETENLYEPKDDAVCCVSCKEDVEVFEINSSQTWKSLDGENSDKFRKNFTKVFAPRPYESRHTVTTKIGTSDSKEQGQPPNRNNGSFRGEYLPKEYDISSRISLENENENFTLQYLPKHDIMSGLLTTSSPTRKRVNAEFSSAFTSSSVNQTNCTTEAHISMMDDAYSAIKTRLYNSALTSLISTMKNTIQENVDNDFVREIWTALNKSVIEMAREFRTFVNSLGLHDNNALSDDIDCLQTLIEQMVIDERLGLKNDVENVMCRLRLHVKETQKNQVIFSSEVEKILVSLTDLTECLTMCGERIFHPKYQWRSYEHIPEKVESPVKLNGFLTTAKTIGQKLVENYAFQTTNEKSKNSYNKTINKFLEDKNGENTSIKQDELFKNNFDENQAQPHENSLNQRSEPHGLTWLNRSQANTCRKYGFILVLIIGVAKILALFGPECLQVAYDIMVGIMMYINCNIHLIHLDPNII
ncbi:hypothetical protein ACF0H5_010780 [Mactra antiquata]